MEMINLLPGGIKEEITFGRRNRLLLRWLFVVFMVIATVAAMTVFGQFYINRNIHSLQAVAKVTQERIANQNLASTQKDIQSLSNNFTTVTQLLGRQLMFSKLFVKIGSIIPNGAILSGITLSTSSSAIDLNVIAVNREAATQAFVNISDPKNGLFDKADLISVNCTTGSANTTASASKYPCTAMIKVIIKNDSSFYFLNSITSGAKKP
jgi:hypothetical protein